jgi:hypothetical protein
VLEAGPTLGWPVTVGQVHRLIRSEEETGEYLKALLEDLEKQGVAVSSLCRRYLLSFCNEPEKPRGSIKSALATKLTLWANPLIDRATARNDFDLRRFRREPPGPPPGPGRTDLEDRRPEDRQPDELQLRRGPPLPPGLPDRASHPGHRRDCASTRGRDHRPDRGGAPDDRAEAPLLPGQDL